MQGAHRSSATITTCSATPRDPGFGPAGDDVPASGQAGHAGAGPEDGGPVARRQDTAAYIAGMVESLARLAERQNLPVLGLMLAMAHDQARADAGSSG